MEIKEMNMEQIEERKAQLTEDMKVDGADLDAIEAEVRSLNERRDAIVKEVEERKKVVEQVINEPVATPVVESRKEKSPMEVRNSKEYVNAYAEYVKRGCDLENLNVEMRTLLSENATNGTIAVPDFVYDIVKTAWDRNEIMSRVTKTSLAGNLKVNFEISGGDAVFHTEGSGAVSEETLTEGIVTIIPKFAKKWISISDEAMAYRGQAFLQYIYNEIAYRIVKLIADTMVDKIAALPTTATATSPNAAQVEAEPGMAVVASAIGNLSDEAANPVIIMNKLTWSAFKAVQYANNYGVDPFEGLTVLFNNSLPSYSTADEGDVYMIVGDLGHGALANFPEGDSIRFTFDELSRKKEDLVEILGKEFVGLGVVACKAFTNVVKPTSVSE